MFPLFWKHFTGRFSPGKNFNTMKVERPPSKFSGRKRSKETEVLHKEFWYVYEGQDLAAGQALRLEFATCMKTVLKFSKHIYNAKKMFAITREA